MRKEIQNDQKNLMINVKKNHKLESILMQDLIVIFMSCQINFNY